MRRCVWRYDIVEDYWDTTCQYIHEFHLFSNITDSGFEHCPYCGKGIRVDRSQANKIIREFEKYNQQETK